MSDPQVQLESLQDVWNTCQTNDDQKHVLIKDLFAYVNDLSARLSEAEYELRDRKDVIKLTRDRIEEADKRIQVFQAEKARHAFASVLIDGDCMLVSPLPFNHPSTLTWFKFNDDLVKAGLDGGKRAARLLKQAVEEELRSSPPALAHHIQVVIRVYANMKGLAKTYKDAEILPQLASLDEFVRGFNMGDPMCDYVDAGNGKECSDEKIKAMFRHDLADMHCHQILFGGSADNGYARLLGPYNEDDAVRSRITLLEGPPFARELAAIKDRYHTARNGVSPDSAANTIDRLRNGRCADSNRAFFIFVV
ncbi:uncharacterized protein J4E87_007711 [Alternaria ethzedia]|uniref:uncharacterized protein n=1 Tax=Alternaria ethzedia TaxID=181014 RepID=UPI0020C330AB|nr:uncharacterized protein J4E87_007711 [Alternaria ethzedia]KAI4619124.1 hypothetical protein J4E87_007711 [Alternaria ethzedia]